MNSLIRIVAAAALGLALNRFGVAADVPTTAPASAAQATAAPVGRPLVEVFAFTSSNDGGHDDWIGRGFQENLQTDVSGTGAVLMIMPQSASAGLDPVATAKKNGANLAVVGTYQVVADQVRVNGQLIDTASRNSVGSFSATGPQRELFKLEDALGEQLRHLLPLPTPTVPIAQTFSKDANYSSQVPVQDASPIVTYSQPETISSYYSTTATAVPYYYPDSFYPAYSSYDAYPYNWGFYGGIGIYAPFYYGGGYGHRGFDRGGFNGGYSRGFSNGFRPNPTFHNPVYHGSFGSGGSRFGGSSFHGRGGRR